MLVTKPAVTTDAGIGLQVLNMSGEQLEFTKLEVGSGQYSQEEATDEALRKRTALKSVKQQFGISSLDVSRDKTTLILSSMLTNAGLKEGYTVRELGLYGRIKDQPDTECLISVCLAEIEDEIPAYNGETESRILMKYQFAVSDSDTVSLSYEHAPVALVEDVDQKYQEVSRKIEVLEGQRDEFRQELRKEFNDLSEDITKLFPDLAAPTKDDVGKVLKIGAGGKAVWAIDSSAQWQSMFPDFAFSTTTDFSGDGNKHVEVTYSNGYKTVSDVLDSKTVKEMLYDPAGQLLATKMVTIAEDGKSVAETVTAE